MVGFKLNPYSDSAVGKSVENIVKKPLDPKT